MRPTRLFAYAALILLAAGCTPASLRLPADVPAQVLTYPVSGHSPRWFNQPVVFGPYRAEAMRESATASWQMPYGEGDLARMTKRFAYRLSTDGQPGMDVQCHARALSAGIGPEAGRVSVDITSIEGPLLACGLRVADAAPLWLSLTREGSDIGGFIDRPGGGRYGIRSLHGLVGTRFDSGSAMGYAIDDGGATVAVVDRLDTGRVMLDPALDPLHRQQLAAAAVALLVLDPEFGD